MISQSVYRVFFIYIFYRPPALCDWNVFAAGLDYLSLLDQLLVKAEVSILEVVLPFEAGNKYSILNNQGQKVYYASEDSNFICRQCCGPRRPWTVHVWSVLTFCLCQLASRTLISVRFL